MPIREFKCTEEHITELILDITDECPHARCIICGRIATRVDVSSTTFRLMPGGAGGFFSPSRG